MSDRMHGCLTILLIVLIFGGILAYAYFADQQWYLDCQTAFHYTVEQCRVMRHNR